jgi:hypothetical protein
MCDSEPRMHDESTGLSEKISVNTEHKITIMNVTGMFLL